MVLVNKDWTVDPGFGTEPVPAMKVDVVVPGAVSFEYIGLMAGF